MGSYAQKLFVFALSPLRLAQGSAYIPPSRRGASRVVPRTYRTFNLPDNGYFDRKFGIAVTSYNGCVITKGMAPFIAPLREGGKPAQACSKRRGESAHRMGL